MKHLLFVNGCIRGAQSRTLELAHEFLHAYRAQYPDTQVDTVDLNELRLQPLYADTLAARNEALGQWDSPLFALARQFRDADLVVLAAPFWEGTFPAAMHTYLEHICVTGLTFQCKDVGYMGKCKAEHAVFFTTRGGIYEQGAAVEDDHAAPFLKTVLGMLGVPNFHMVAAEGLDIQGFDAEGAMETARRKAEQLAHTL
ncbi:MAG: NAD(P)H-dependent oxidoreductase [Butyricicoccus sp.]|nr:NAD(P)H-dependent oxidoreductase [Butyricicoccus sp.]